MNSTHSFICMILNFASNSTVLYGKVYNNPEVKSDLVVENIMNFFTFRNNSNVISSCQNTTWEPQEEIPIANQTLKIIVCII